MLLLLLACPPPKDDSAADDTAADTDTALSGPAGPATAEHDCAPDDGAAVRFMIGLATQECDADTSGTAHLRLTLWTAWPLDPGSYPLDSSSGVAWLAPEDGGAELSISEGTLTIDEWGTAILGSYRVTVGGGDTYEGAFDAIWCENELMCG
jgi:hypothetical protein